MIVSNGLSAIKPPWTSLTVFDLNAGTIKWQIPLGEVPELAAKGFRNTNTHYPKVNFIGHAQTSWANIDKACDNSPRNLHPIGEVTPGGFTDRYLSDARTCLPIYPPARATTRSSAIRIMRAFSSSGTRTNCFTAAIARIGPATRRPARG